MRLRDTELNIFCLCGQWWAGSTSCNHISFTSQTGQWAAGTSAPTAVMSVFVGARSGQRQGNCGVLQMRLDDVVELFSVLIELHDALRFFSHPELVKFISQITWKSSNWKCKTGSEVDREKKKDKIENKTYSKAGESALVQVSLALCCRNGVSRHRFSSGCRPSLSSWFQRWHTSTYSLTKRKMEVWSEGCYGLLVGAEMRLCHNTIVCAEIWSLAYATKSPLPEFRVVGMRQHLTSLLCVVLAEKPEIKRNVVLKKTDSNRTES